MAKRASSRGAKMVTKAMFERFTEKAIKVVMLAQEEARRLGHVSGAKPGMECLGASLALPASALRA